MKPHIYQSFDGDLKHLHDLVLAMTDRISTQFDNMLLALNHQDSDIAVTIIREDTDIDQFELKIDAEVISSLARHHPVVNDLRNVVAVSKIVTDLERIGDELVKIAWQIIDLSTAERKLNRKLLGEITKISEMIGTVLHKTAHCFGSRDVEEAYQLINSDDIYKKEFRDSLTNQFSMLLHNHRLLGNTLNILQIISALERCSKHCINIAEHMVFMLEGKDIRHEKFV